MKIKNIMFMKMMMKMKRERKKMKKSSIKLSVGGSILDTIDQQIQWYVFLKKENPIVKI
jgi:hypothetical protein